VHGSSTVALVQFNVMTELKPLGAGKPFGRVGAPHSPKLL
jgi:hypothetical protein